MAIEKKVMDLLKAVKNDPKAQEALKGMTKPTDEEGIVNYYAKIAELLGYEVTETDIREAVSSLENERTEKTENTAAAIQSLPDEELGHVAGGKNTYNIPHHDECSSAVGDWTEVVECYTTFEQRENCMSHDACDYNIMFYHGYQCEHNAPGHHCGNSEKFDCSSVIF